MTRIQMNYMSFPEAKQLPAVVAKLAEEQAELASRSRELGQEHLELITGAEYAEADAADKAARSAAVRAGEPDPGAVNVAAFNRKRADLVREISSLSVALVTVQTELEDALAANIEELVAHAEQTEDKAAASLTKAIKALQAAHDNYAVALGLAGWAYRVREAVTNPGTSPTGAVYEPESPDPLRTGRQQLDTVEMLQALPEVAETHTRRRKEVAEKATLEAAYAARLRRVQETDTERQRREVTEQMVDTEEAAVA